MQTKKEKTSSKSASHGNKLRMFDMKKTKEANEFNEYMDNLISNKEKEIEHLQPKFKKLVEWLKEYVNSPDLMELHKDEYLLEMTAEATFWSVRLGLESHLAKMSYKDIMEFQPTRELLFDNTERAKLINAVCGKLVKPTMSHEQSRAIQQAVWCIYVHHHSFEKMKEEEIAYDLEESSQSVRPN